MIQVWIDFPTEDRSSVTRAVEQVPRIGESIGVVSLGGDHFRLDKVVDVRHYLLGDRPPEIRILVEP